MKAKLNPRKLRNNSKKFRLLVVVQNKNLPSARFRILQYITPFLKQNFEVDVFDMELNFKKLKEPLLHKFRFYTMILTKLLKLLFKLRQYEIVFLQREIIPTKYTIEKFISSTLIFDVDDAIWIKGKGVDKIAAKSHLVITGNKFLQDHYKFKKETVVIPTAVDLNYWKPFPEKHTYFTIGWSGSGGENTLRELYALEPAFTHFLERHQDSIVSIMTNADKINFSLLSKFRERIIIHKWDYSIEKKFFNSIDIGIMPLENTKWNKGKCGYKMLLYMAMKKPVIASPVGINSEIIEKSEAGLLANNINEWEKALEFLYKRPGERNLMGLNGRNYVAKYFNKNYWGSVLVETILKVHNDKKQNH